MDLSRLSTEEKLEALRLLEAKDFIEKENVLDTQVLNEPQKKFYQSKAIIRLFCGGNGSGKSRALLHELTRTHLRCHEHRNVDNINRTWFFMPDLKKVEEYLSELKKICPPSKFPQTDRLGTPNIRRLLWKDGSVTTFYSYEQDSMVAEGANLDAVFWDEPPPRSLFIAAYRGLRSNPDHFMVFGLTPISEPWIYTELYLPAVNKEDPSKEVILASTYDNKANLSEVWLENFKNSLSDDEIRVRLYGEFASLQGRVFKEFNRQTHVVKHKPWPNDWPVWLCVDPHSRKPSTAVWAGVTKDEELVVLEEASAEGIQELGELINRIEERHKWRVVSRIIDNSGSARDWSGSTAIDIFKKKCNLSFRPVSNDEKDVDEGIFRLKELFRLEKLPDGRTEPRLYVMENCKKTIQDLEMYGWQESRNPEKTGLKEAPKKVWDDYVDPLRYIVMQRPRFRAEGGIISYGSGYSKSKRSPLWDKLIGSE